MAFVLGEVGDDDGALRAYGRAAELAPAAIEPHVARGLLLFRLARNDEAEAALLHALALDPHEPRANGALYELLHVKGDLTAAVACQRRVLERQQLFSTIAAREQRSVLVLCAPGDLQANIPVDFLFDPETTTVHKLYLLDASRLASTALPRYDVVLNAIAESPTSANALALAESFLRAQNRPSLNRPERVAATNRLRLTEQLRGTCRLASIAPATAVELRRDGSPLAYPIIIRPVGSHAGHGLEKVDDADTLAAYLERSTADAFYVSEFIDYRSADGFYRKYRIICVDGEPYPCHLAISPAWMIHYYNAAMAEHQWKRDEEAAFLADLARVFGPALVAALRDVAERIGLEYVGIDCTIDPEGGLFVFEADPAMVVHVSDSPELYPYKREYVPRIFRAVERMIDRRKETAAAT